MIYVADSQSNATNNPGFKQGIRIGSVKDGKVAAFIPEPSAEAGAPEGIGVDDAATSMPAGPPRWPCGAT
jgi:hypothetical protein